MKISTIDSPLQTIYQELNGFAKFTLSRTLVKVRSFTVTVLCGVFSSLCDHNMFVFCYMSCPCQTYGPREQVHSAVWSCSLMGDGHAGGPAPCASHWVSQTPSWLLRNTKNCARCLGSSGDRDAIPTPKWCKIKYSSCAEWHRLSYPIPKGSQKHSQGESTFEWEAVPCGRANIHGRPQRTVVDKKQGEGLPNRGDGVSKDRIVKMYSLFSGTTMGPLQLEKALINKNNWLWSSCEGSPTSP